MECKDENERETNFGPLPMTLTENKVDNHTSQIILGGRGHTTCNMINSALSQAKGLQWKGYHVDTDKKEIVVSLTTKIIRPRQLLKDNMTLLQQEWEDLYTQVFMIEENHNHSSPF
jgi:DNA-directed RNA polymerase subunit L